MEENKHKIEITEIEISPTGNETTCQGRKRRPRRKRHLISSAIFFWLFLFSLTVCVMSYLAYFESTRQDFLFHAMTISGIVCLVSLAVLASRFSKRYFNEEHDRSDCQYPYFGF